MSPTAKTPEPERASPAVREEWTRARRIVIKIGSALLVDRTTGRLRSTWLNSIADDVLAKTGSKSAPMVSTAIALMIAGGLFLGAAQNASAAEGQEKPPANKWSAWVAMSI